MPPSQSARSTKAARRQAAVERAAALRRQAELKERRRRVQIGFGAAAALVGVVAAVVLGIRGAQNDDRQAGTAANDVSGVGAALDPPWPLPEDVDSRVAAAGLDTGPMGTADHYHVHLDIFVDGVEVTVPADLGVDPATGAMSAVHTHTPDGLVHVEADKVGEAFTLGQLFTQWDVRLSEDQIGSLVASPDEPLKVYVDGAEQTGDPAQLRLADRQQISIVYGDQGVDVPDSYDFSGI